MHVYIVLHAVEREHDGRENKEARGREVTWLFSGLVVRHVFL